MIKKIIKFITSDDVEFALEEDAERYESLIGKNLSIENFCWMSQISHDQYKQVPDEFEPKKEFKKGDIIHTIDCHCLEDSYGNDICQDITFINKSIITGTYIVESGSSLEGYDCISVETVFEKDGGITTFVSDDIILENYQ